MSSEKREDIIHQKITNTVNVDDALNRAVFSATFKPDYHLPLSEFKDLKGSTRSIDNLVTNAFWLSVGLGINCGGKYLSTKLGFEARIETFEFVIFGITTFITIIFFVIAKITPDEKKMTLAKIEKHFKESPEQKMFFHGDNN